jgi:hypothetical protein
MRTSNLPRAAGLLALAAVLAAGCGTGRAKANISGKVIYHGAPVTGGTLTIYHPGSAPYTVPIRGDGTFISSDLPVGEAKVTVETESLRPARAAGAPRLPRGMQSPRPADAGGTPTAYVKIPPRYASPQSTPLVWHLKGGTNNKDFDLE